MSAILDLPVKEHYYSQHAVALRAELGRAISRDLMRQLQRKTPWRHLLVAARQFLILGLTTWALDTVHEPADLGSAQLRAGLHRLQLHGAAPRGRAPYRSSSGGGRWRSASLGLLYAMPSGISASQFTRWHLDHHAELGLRRRRSEAASSVAEAERALVQAAVLHAGAVSDLLPRGAARERDVPGGICSGGSRASGGSRSGFHLTAIALLWWTSSASRAALRAHVIPVFFVFPIAFTLNRLGQHYDIDPSDPAKWGTLMKGQLVLGLRVPQLELPPRAPLLPGRAVLQPAQAAARARAVLRAQAHALAAVRASGVGVARQEPCAAYRLGARESFSRAGGRAEPAIPPIDTRSAPPRAR